jgi:hypothetical protein
VCTFSCLRVWVALRVATFAKTFFHVPRQLARLRVAAAARDRRRHGHRPRCLVRLARGSVDDPRSASRSSAGDNRRVLADWISHAHRKYSGRHCLYRQRDIVASAAGRKFVRRRAGFPRNDGHGRGRCATWPWGVFFGCAAFWTPRNCYSPAFARLNPGPPAVIFHSRWLVTLSTKALGSPPKVVGRHLLMVLTKKYSFA